MDNKAEALRRLDKLIDKGHVQFFKPIIVAEMLHASRMQGADLSDRKRIKAIGSERMKIIALRLYYRHVDLNYGYIGGIFDDDKLTPPMLLALASINKADGEIERRIYTAMQGRWSAYRPFFLRWSRPNPQTFSIGDFIAGFDKLDKIGNVKGKLYEIVVYALFQCVIDFLNARVTFAVDPKRAPLLDRLESFAEVVLGLESNEITLTQKARVFRAGRAHASDSGIDMWANFGPVVQVKHQSSGSMNISTAEKVAGPVRCDRLVLICRRKTKKDAEEFRDLMEAKSYVRIIDEERVVSWYDEVFTNGEFADVRVPIATTISAELAGEFPIPSEDKLRTFFAERDY